ncbi:MAG TPA: NAD(P)/FAD-dependent oxidoreductase [Candidatus Acidoferrales bacterium]|nr:NAD(P)/FAD-dependent oxidoreductase [Candidatus Acidoferrales bacterium]
MQRDTDVFVIGGGPAGLAVAIAARQKGFRVTLADPVGPGADKACGEGVMPEGVEALRELGVEVPAGEARPFCGIRFLDGGRVAEARFAKGQGLGIRRTTLHRVLVERAEACGVQLLWRTKVSGISAEGVALASGVVRTRWICGADGGHSRVRRWLGLDRGAGRAPRYGTRRHFRVRAWSDCVEVYWGRESQLYVAPVGEEELCIATISRVPGIRVEQALAVHPELAARLAGAGTASGERGGVTSSLRLRRVYRGRVALVGDASGSVDAITGQGLSLAFQQAHALAAAMEAGDLAQYQAAHGRIRRRPEMMARLLLAMDGRPRLRARVLRILSEEPHHFTRLLAAHTGAASTMDCALGGLGFGWRLVTP